MALHSLSLCSGIGGLDLGLSRWARTVCYVERDKQAVRVLLERIARGDLASAPIFDDLLEFDGSAFAGAVDIVAAGFPCQPFSTASRGRRTARDLWPEVLRVIGECRPGYVFLENVQRAPIERAAIDLDGLGFTSHHDPYDSAELGSPHRRVRWWLLAHADGYGKPGIAVDAKASGLPQAARLAWWRSSPRGVLGVDDGISNRMDRLRMLGNAVVPQCAAYAFEALSSRITDKPRGEAES